MHICFVKGVKVVFLLAVFLAVEVLASEPITTDNRIKTYIYNENDVYNLVVNYGYQSSIEFANDEKVSTISLGDTYAWRVTPVGRRLFIKPMQENMHTNMTIITNKRTYQFDLFSKEITTKLEKELVYVMRFFYPSELEVINRN